MRNFIAILLLCWGHLSYACDCVAQPELKVRNWNDSEMIFVAKLIDYKKTPRYGYLKFAVVKNFKGSLDEEVTIFFQPKKSHSLLHLIKDFRLKKKWIVFAYVEKIKGKNYYRLQKNYDSKYCGLSRPTQSDEDIYFPFLRKMAALPDGFYTFTHEDSLVIAQGNYENKMPVGSWVYADTNGIRMVCGFYENGKKVGEWLKYSINKYKKHVILQQAFYDKNGIMRKRFNFSYFGDLRTKVIYEEERKTIFQYRNGYLISKKVKDSNNKTLSRYRYRKGELIKEEHFTPKS